MQPRSTGEEELARRLEAYASERLSPSPAAAARMRVRVMHEARMTLDGAAATPPASGARPVELSSWRIGRLGRGARRMGGVLLAASLALGLVAGVTFGAQPGGPLYGPRLWFEAATLPSDPTDRTTADISRLEARLAEAVAASADGNQGAMTAALAAYDEVVTDALAAAGDDPALMARLEEALNKHVLVLQALLDKVPDQATDAIQQAITESSKAIDKVGNGGGPGGTPGSGTPRATPSAGNGGTGGQPSRSPKPEQSAKPEKSPPAQPIESPGPGRTPPPGQASPAPGHTPPGPPQSPRGGG